MHRRVPIIEGKMPNEEYNLDNKSDLRKLGLDPDVDVKIADKYVHYRNCRYAVVEFKGSTLRKAVTQLEVTVKRLLGIGKKVDFAIIVMNRLSRWEKRIFKRRMDKVLLNPQTSKPYTIKADSRTFVVLLFYSSEVNKMYSGLIKYLSEGQN